MPTIIDLHSHLGYEITPKNDEDESNLTRENVIDHLGAVRLHGHALTHSLGNDIPAIVIDVRYAGGSLVVRGPACGVAAGLRPTAACHYTDRPRGLAWGRHGKSRAAARR